MENENTPPTKDSNGGEEPHPSPRDSKGWDGKLRVERRPILANPQAISDSEYSDEENVLPGEQISADRRYVIICFIETIFCGGGTYDSLCHRSS